MITVVRSPTPPPKKHKRDAEAVPADPMVRPSKRMRAASPPLPPPPAHGQPLSRGREMDTAIAAGDRAPENGRSNGRGSERHDRMERQRHESPHGTAVGAQLGNRRAGNSLGGRREEGRSQHRSRDERQEEPPREQRSSKHVKGAVKDEDDRWNGGEQEHANLTSEQHTTRSGSQRAQRSHHD